MVLLVQIHETIAAKTGRDKCSGVWYSHSLGFYLFIIFLSLLLLVFSSTQISLHFLFILSTLLVSQCLPGQCYIFNLFPRTIIMSQTWDSVRHFIERPEWNVTKMKRIRESLESSEEIRSAPQMLISNRRRGDAGERMLLSGFRRSGVTTSGVLVELWGSS